MFNELFHVEDEAFEVFAFGVVDVYRVILGLMQLVEDAHGASHLRCGEPESLFVHSLGAGEGKEDAAGSDHLNRLGVNALVAAKGILHRIAVFGKSRGIEDDEVVRFSC